MHLITVEDDHKLTPIHWAIAFKHVEQLKAMIKRFTECFIRVFVCFINLAGDR